MKQIIGFATQFYTLWNYEAVTQCIADSYGNHHQSCVAHKYEYCKNISTDLDKVKSLFPNIEIDTELRGTSSFTHNEIIGLPNNYFWAGKYAGKLIDEIMEFDFNYCIWSAENYKMPYITTHPKYIAHFEAIEKQMLLEIANAQTVKAGDVVVLDFVRNGCNTDDNSAECWTEAKFGDTVVHILCSGGKQVCGMYPYIMPIVNGKSMKTKGKKIEVNVLEVFNTFTNCGQVEQKIKIA